MNLQNIPTRILVFVFIILCFITRLPQLLSPNILLDGDESILGLLSKHIAEGKGFPIFFYGQNYGFSLLEGSFGAISFLVFGVNAVALRVSLLLLWSIGIVFFFLSFLQLTNKKTAFLITLLMVLIPAWAIGSMKARGGYITAFTLTSIVIYLILKAKESPTVTLSFIIGAITFIIYLSRPFWIPGLLPVFVYAYAFKRNYRGILALCSGALLFFLIFQFILPKPYVFWEPKLFIVTSYWDAIKEIPVRIFYNTTGSYCLENNIALGFFDRISSYLFDGLLILLFAIQGYRIINKKYLVWSSVFCISILFTIAYTPFFTKNYGARYLLPYSQFLVCWMGVEVIDFIQQKKFLKYFYAFVSILFIFCIGALIEFKDFNFLPESKSTIPEKSRVEEVITYLADHGVHDAFTIDGMTQWSFIFYSNESLICRSLSPIDRYPRYPELVDKAMNACKPTALIWMKEGVYKLEQNPEYSRDIILLGGRYFVYLHPSKDLLKKMNFRFRE